jgi:hypothetical protein
MRIHCTLPTHEQHGVKAKVVKLILCLIKHDAILNLRAG